MSRALLQQALDALRKAERQVVYADVAPHGCISEALKALQAALAQPEPDLTPLTDAQIDEVTALQWGPQIGAMNAAYRAYARAIETACNQLQIKIDKPAG